MHASEVGGSSPVATKAMAPNQLQNVSPAAGDNEATEPKNVSEAQEGESGKGSVVNIKA